MTLLKSFVFFILIVAVQSNSRVLLKCVKEFENSNNKGISPEIATDFCYDQANVYSNSFYDIQTGICQSNQELKHISEKHFNITGSLSYYHISIAAFGKEFHLFPDGSYEKTDKFDLGPASAILDFHYTPKRKSQFIKFLDKGKLMVKVTNEFDLQYNQPNVQLSDDEIEKATGLKRDPQYEKLMKLTS